MKLYMTTRRVDEISVDMDCLERICQRAFNDPEFSFNDWKAEGFKTKKEYIKMCY